MTIGRDRLVRVDEVPNDLDSIRSVPKVLGRPPARKYQTVIARRLDVGKCYVGLDSVTGLLDVGIELGLEVMNDRVKGPLRRRRDVDRPPLFLKTEFGVVDSCASPASPVRIRIFTMIRDSRV
jgi:hypothetical protein